MQEPDLVVATGRISADFTYSSKFLSEAERIRNPDLPCESGLRVSAVFASVSKTPYRRQILGASNADYSPIYAPKTVILLSSFKKGLVFWGSYRLVYNGLGLISALL